MTIAELTRDVQFTVDQQGQVTAVVIDPAIWQKILSALETSEDHALVAVLQTRLAQGPNVSGALPWKEVAYDYHDLAELVQRIA